MILDVVNLTRIFLRLQSHAPYEVREQHDCSLSRSKFLNPYGDPCDKCGGIRYTKRPGHNHIILLAYQSAGKVWPLLHRPDISHL